MNYAPVILVVADELRMRKSICELLQGAGYAVSASSPAGAAHVLSDGTRSVALLVIDVGVDLRGERPGTGLAERLRRLRPSLKALMIVDSPEEGREFDEDIDYLRKPFAKLNLVRKIDMLLAGKDELFRRDCGWIKKLLARRYPQLHIECEEDPGDQYLIKLAFAPGLISKEVRFSVREYLDGRWKDKISSAVERLE